MAKEEIKRGDGSIVTADTEEHSLTYYRYHARFTPIEWKILCALYKKRGEQVTRAEIIMVIWGADKIIPTRTIDVHVSSIRKKLAYIKGARIDSVYGTGYRLVMLRRF